MTAVSLNTYLDARAADPAIRLIADTAAVMRADAAYLERDDDVAAAVFLVEEPAAGLGEDALDQVLARIERADDQDRRACARAEARPDPREAELAALPSPLREAAFTALDRDGWSFVAFGIRRLVLDTGAGMRAVLMRIEPGAGVFHHDHAGDEVTLIVRGAYADGHARFGPGDVSVAQPGFRHSPKAERGDICYALTAFDGPPRFTGLMGWVQRATGLPVRLPPDARA